jgi:hypothetical protein
MRHRAMGQSDTERGMTMRVEILDTAHLFQPHDPFTTPADALEYIASLPPCYVNMTIHPDDGTWPEAPKVQITGNAPEVSRVAAAVLSAIEGSDHEQDADGL